MKQLLALVRPFPSKFVHGNPSGGGSYVKHHVIEQRLLHVLGTAPATRVIELLRGDVAGKKPNPNGSSQRAKDGTPDLTNVVVGVVLSMEATVDGELIHVEEVGDCEEPHNWATDGARAKDAFSDAYKRCAMRMGVGLHMYSQQEFYIDEALRLALDEDQPEPNG